MADKKIVIAFEMKEDGKGFGQMTLDAEAFGKVMRATAQEADKLGRKFLNFAAFAASIDQITGVIGGLQKSLADLQGAYAMQVEAETKLAVNMRNTMGAREEDIQSIKDLCSAQQELGVIGDEVQLAGAQELATYLEKKESLEALIPVMNDMLAQQYGLNATQESAAQIATMLGKVMEGQTGALSRYGYKFDEAQEQILKFGTESQRAAVLAEVVESAVGGMNAELAKTDVGRQKQLENALGDLKEQAGQLAQKILPIITYSSQAAVAMGGMVKAWQGIKTLKTAIASLGSGVLAFTKSVREAGFAARIFGVTLKSVLVTSGIGVAVVGLGYAISWLAGKFDDAADSADKLSEAEQRAKRVAEQNAEAVQEEQRAYHNAMTSIDVFKARIENFNGTKEEEKKLVNELNNTYGESMGYFSSVQEWYKALTANSEDYCRQMQIEARTRKLANMIADAEQEKHNILFDEAGNRKMYSTKRERVLETYQKEGDSRTYTTGKYIDKVGSSELDKANKAISDINKQIEHYNNQLQGSVKEASTIKLSVKGAATAPSTSTGKGGGGATSNEPQWTEEADTIEKVQENIRYLEKERAKASGAELESLNQRLQGQQTLLRSLQEVGVAATQTEKTLNESPQTIKDYADNIAYLNEKIETATGDDLTRFNKLLKEQQDGMNALRNQGIEEPKTTEPEDKSVKALNLKATKLREIQDNLTFLNNQLQDADATEAALINKQIDLWQKKADAIQNAGKSSVSAMENIKSSWSNTKSISSGINGISDALEKNGTIWEKLQGIIDGFFQIFDGVSAIVTLINNMTEASREHATAKIIESAATGVSAGAASADAIAQEIDTKATESNTQATIANTGAKAGEAMANATASGANLPFPANIAAIAAGVAAVVGVLAAVGCFANGGIVGGSSPSGDKLVARVNSGEMILNRSQQANLFSMLNNPAYMVRTVDIARPQPIVNIQPSAASMNDLQESRPQSVRFRIDGRTLVGILEKEINLNLRR